jgi:predicted GNAT family N-acyltransferase
MDSIVKPIVRITRATSRDDLRKAFAIRTRVFVREQGVPAEIELDRDDWKAIHFLALISGNAVGTARVVFRRHHAKIGRMAVLKSYRGMGVGSKLLKRAIETAKKRRARRIYLHAQVAVSSFYQSAGFRAVGPVFEEAGIPHRKMTWTKRSPAR